MALVRCASSVGTEHVVATDFNPLGNNGLIKQSSVGTIHFVATDFNPLVNVVATSFN